MPAGPQEQMPEFVSNGMSAEGEEPVQFLTLDRLRDLVKGNAGCGASPRSTLQGLAKEFDQIADTIRLPDEPPNQRGAD